MASSRDNLKVYIQVTQKKSVSENPKSSKKQKTSSAEENIDEQENISRKSPMKQQRTRKRKDISDNVKKQEEKQKRRRKKVVIESSEETVSDSNDKKSRRAIVLHNSEQEVNSDDDFVDPQPRVNPTKNQKKEKAESKPKRSQRKDKTKEQPEQQPYYDYDGKKINIRCAVNNLKDYIESLSKEQRNAVREIGFKSILKFNLHSVPRKFGYWLVKNFDAENNEINTGVEKIKITAEFIQKILYAYKKQGFDDAENTEVFSLDKIDSTTLQEFKDKLEIAAQNEGRCLNENEEIFENESEENDEDDAAEQPITLLKAATEWIDQENQENVQNSPIKTNKTEKTQTESGGSWGQFFIKPSIGNKDKMRVDSQSRLRNFMPSQNQSEGLSDIHSTKSGDENMKNIEDKRSHEEYLVTVLDDYLKGFEDIFENI
ncbi:myosin heavy chain, clone 203-like [Helianthus annuus]|uniref:myosin heavy chain, clone 203-like n=1 Tax=Helianthus annuus TaxID=4232 RepID=UPI000B900091|nr:myosin heavy chain, clone 203-like [Helianthus annuus]